MRIAIDTQTTMGQKTGFGYYVENLVTELKKVDNINQYSLISPRSEKDYSSPQRLAWDQFILPVKARKLKADILHQPAFSAPALFNKPVVVTVHDLIAIHYPKDIPFWSSQYFGKWMPFSYRFADHIISISEHTKKDIKKILNIPDHKMTVIYEAADRAFHPISDKNSIEKIKNKYHIRGNYLLHIGTLNPRKNLNFLIDVFSSIVKKHPNYQLAIAGKEGWYYEGLFSQVEKLGLQKKVIFLGYIEEEDKALLINGATTFVFPSLYEGFGLPVLEAMACGVPVVSTNQSSLPELVEKAGILVSPKSGKDWFRTIDELLSDSQLRRQYSNLGLAQAKKFSWEKTARETIKVYEKVYKESNK